MLKVEILDLPSLAAHLKAGRDPLGDRFIRHHCEEHRRLLGATYTPRPIVDAMIDAARRRCVPQRIIDAGAGSGRFAIAAAAAFPEAEIIAVEVDPGTIEILRANLAALGVAERVRVVAGDYRELRLPAIDGCTLFIGNPPYVRHHRIASEWKRWYGALAQRFDVRASGLAGLHLHFFAKTLELARHGDFGCFITAGEWLDVNYGAALRSLLLGPLGGLSVDLFAAEDRVFDDTLTTAAITCFAIGAQPKSLRFGRLSLASRPLKIAAGRAIGRDQLRTAPRWTGLAEGAIESADRVGPVIGDLFRVKRGQVTGANDVWIVGPETPKLPERYLHPTITKARELIDACDRLRSDRRLRRVIDLPPDLSDLPAAQRKSVDAFLRWAECRNAPSGYIARHRSAWWSVGLYQPAPILCTYMGRRPPVFVRNLCGARHINIAHGLYPRQPLSGRALDRAVAWLNANVSRQSGRTYAGGLTKFEPREIERIAIPSIEDLIGA